MKTYCAVTRKLQLVIVVAAVTSVALSRKNSHSLIVSNFCLEEMSFIVAV